MIQIKLIVTVIIFFCLLCLSYAKTGLVDFSFGLGALSSKLGDHNNELDALELGGIGVSLSYEKKFNGAGLEIKAEGISLTDSSASLFWPSRVECDINSFGVSYFLYLTKVFKGFYFGPGFDYMRVKITEKNWETTGLLGFPKDIEYTESRVNLGNLSLSFGYSALLAELVSFRLGLQYGYLFKLNNIMGADKFIGENYKGSFELTDRLLLNAYWQFGIVF